MKTTLRISITRPGCGSNDTICIGLERIVEVKSF